MCYSWTITFNNGQEPARRFQAMYLDSEPPSHKWKAESKTLQLETESVVKKYNWQIDLDIEENFRAALSKSSFKQNSINTGDTKSRVDRIIKKRSEVLRVTLSQCFTRIHGILEENTNIRVEFCSKVIQHYKTDPDWFLELCFLINQNFTVIAW